MTGLMTRNASQIIVPCALPDFLLNTVKNAISTAWRMLREKVDQGAFSICRSTEDQITAELHELLGQIQANQNCLVPGFDEICAPIREPKVRDYQEKALDRMPDLAFYPPRGSLRTWNTTFTGLFVECKPIDQQHPVVSVYGDNGMIRFLNGDYAWAVDKALMVAYARNHCVLPEGLYPALAKTTLACSHSEVVTATCEGDSVFRSIHLRQFELDSARVSLGPIQIDHLWLKTNSPCEPSRCRTHTSINGDGESRKP